MEKFRLFSGTNWIGRTIWNDAGWKHWKHETLWQESTRTRSKSRTQGVNLVGNRYQVY